MINTDQEDNLDGFEQQTSGVGSFVLEIVKVFLLAFIIIVPIRIFLFQPFFVQGASMEPNFENDEYLIINELGYKETAADIYGTHLFTVEPFREVDRGVVIVFRYPKNRSQFFIKRVIGLPGEKVELNDGKVFIYNDENPDGFQLDESAYLSRSVKTSGNLVLRLKEDEYFVMGDNRPASLDSRSWGPVNEGDIVGKVMLRAWPLDRLDVF